MYTWQTVTCCVHNIIGKLKKKRILRKVMCATTKKYIILILNLILVGKLWFEYVSLRHLFLESLNYRMFFILNSYSLKACIVKTMLFSVISERKFFQFSGYFRTF